MFIAVYATKYKTICIPVRYYIYNSFLKIILNIIKGLKAYCYNGSIKNDYKENHNQISNLVNLMNNTKIYLKEKIGFKRSIENKKTEVKNQHNILYYSHIYCDSQKIPWTAWNVLFFLHWENYYHLLCIQ